MLTGLLATTTRSSGHSLQIITAAPDDNSRGAQRPRGSAAVVTDVDTGGTAVSTVAAKEEGRATRPAPLAVEMPETLGYRIKNRPARPADGQRAAGDRAAREPRGMGVLTPDGISSPAYGTEEMLVELVKYVGVASFTLVLPVTFALLLVLFFVTLSYREVVMVYTRAGGSYVVAQGQLRPDRRPGGRRRTAHRLHGHGRGPDRRRHRRA